MSFRDFREIPLVFVSFRDFRENPLVLVVFVSFGRLTTNFNAMPRLGPITLVSFCIGKFHFGLDAAILNRECG